MFKGGNEFAFIHALIGFNCHVGKFFDGYGMETAGEIVSQDSDTEQAYLAFICKRLKLNFRKLSVEERKWLKKIAEKSDLLKNPKPQRGRR